VLSILAEDVGRLSPSASQILKKSSEILVYTLTFVGIALRGRKDQIMRKYLTFFLALSFICLLGSCAKSEPTAATGDYDLVASIKDIMDTQIDPSADYIWQSIGTEVSAEGIKDKRPQNSDEWKEARRKAMLLVEGANLLMMPGRKVAKPGEKSENPEVELQPEQIQELIDKDRPSFIKLAKEFQKIAIEQLKAVEDKDVDAMLRLGGTLDETCEGCHKVYWYPNDPVYKEQSQAAPTGAAEPAPAEKK